MRSTRTSRTKAKRRLSLLAESPALPARSPGGPRLTTEFKSDGKPRYRRWPSASTLFLAPPVARKGGSDHLSGLPLSLLALAWSSRNPLHLTAAEFSQLCTPACSGFSCASSFSSTLRVAPKDAWTQEASVDATAPPPAASAWDRSLRAQGSPGPAVRAGRPSHLRCTSSAPTSAPSCDESIATGRRMSAAISERRPATSERSLDATDPQKGGLSLSLGV